MRSSQDNEQRYNFTQDSEKKNVNSPIQEKLSIVPFMLVLLEDQAICKMSTIRK